MIYVFTSSLILIIAYILVFLHHTFMYPLTSTERTIAFIILFINIVLCTIFSAPKTYYVTEYKQEYINTTNVYQTTYYLYRNNQFYVHYTIGQDINENLTIGDSILLYDTDVQTIYYLREENNNE